MRTKKEVYAHGRKLSNKKDKINATIDKNLMNFTTGGSNLLKESATDEIYLI